MTLADQQRLLQQYDFKRFVFETYPNFIYAHFLADIIARLQKAMFQTRKTINPRINILLPPRHGKTTLMQRFLLWSLLNNPEWEVTIVSYSQTLADKSSLAARNILENNSYIKQLWPHIKISKERSSVKEWYIYNNNKLAGCFRAVGVGGSLTGHGFSILCCDDLQKNIEEADSRIMRDKVWDWYTSVALTRQAPQNAIININTRWHIDDHIGRLLKAESNQWDTLKYPAIIDNKVLMPQRFTANQLMKLQSTMAPRLWEALYMQEPVNVAGNLIKKEHLHFFDKLPEEPTQLVQSWDLRFSKSQASTSSYVVGQVWAKCGQSFYCIDQVRERLSYVESKQAIIAMSNKYPLAMIKLVEKKANGDALEDDLNALGIELIEPRGDKVQRVERVYGLIVTGRVFFHESMRSTIEPEFLSFPNGEHDDQCLVAGTKISTLFGDKNIEDIKKGDYVLTPLGYSKVSFAGCTGIKSVITKHGITGTKNHPVFCKEELGFCNLNNTIKPVRLDFRSYLWIRLFVRLSGTVRFMPLSGVAGITLDQRKLMQQGKVFQCCIGIFTSFIAVKKYRKALSFTTRMAITLIMTILIWSAYRSMSMVSDIGRILGQKSRRLGVKRTSTVSDLWHPFGTLLKRGLLGIGNTVRIAWQKKITPLLPRFAYAAIKNIPSKPSQQRGQSIVPAIVARNIHPELDQSNLKQSLVAFAEPPKKSKNCLKEGLLAEIGNADGVQNVYNLTVQAGVYYANGVLVHNCDAASQFLNYTLDFESFWEYLQN
jgi:predicted phage terminase large subunit-like protein